MGSPEFKLEVQHCPADAGSYPSASSNPAIRSAASSCNAGMACE